MNNRLEHALSYAKNRSNGLPIQEALKPNHYIYLLQCQRYVKIGIAKNVVSRVRSMQVGNPFRITILAALPTSTPRQDEAHLHSELAHYRMCGEWFNVPARELRKLVSRMQPGPETPKRRVLREGFLKTPDGLRQGLR